MNYKVDKKGLTNYNKEKLLNLSIAEYVYSFTEFCENFGFEYNQKDIEDLKEYYLTKTLELDLI